MTLCKLIDTCHKAVAVATDVMLFLVTLAAVWLVVVIAFGMGA